MKMLKVAAMLLASGEATVLNVDSAEGTVLNADVLKSFEVDSREQRLSQSFASAFELKPPKLMTTKGLPAPTHGSCPKPGKKLTYKASGQAFPDGCYMNTTRKSKRNEATGEDGQHYLYMWKHACAFTKWVPSNQFMYSNLDFNPETMTLERFGFIGMDKRCYWGSIGVLWKRPLPVDQILPNNTLTVQGPTLLKVGQLVNTLSDEGLCLNGVKKDLKIDDCSNDGKNDWQLFDSGEIKLRKTDLCVTISKGANETPILLQDCNGSKSQKWKIKPTTGNKFQIVSQKYDKCVNILGTLEAAKGQKANIFTCYLNDNMEYVWKNE